MRSASGFHRASRTRFGQISRLGSCRLAYSWGMGNRSLRMALAPKPTYFDSCSCSCGAAGRFLRVNLDCQLNQVNIALGSLEP